MAYNFREWIRPAILAIAERTRVKVRVRIGRGSRVYFDILTSGDRFVVATAL